MNKKKETLKQGTKKALQKESEKEYIIFVQRDGRISLVPYTEKIRKFTTTSDFENAVIHTFKEGDYLEIYLCGIWVKTSVREWYGKTYLRDLENLELNGKYARIAEKPTYLTGQPNRKPLF